MSDLLILLGFACAIAGAVFTLVAAFDFDATRILIGQVIFLGGFVTIMLAAVVGNGRS